MTHKDLLVKRHKFQLSDLINFQDIFLQLGSLSTVMEAAGEVVANLIIIRELNLALEENS